jgi:hypothetical protein
MELWSNKVHCLMKCKPQSLKLVRDAKKTVNVMFGANILPCHAGCAGCSKPLSADNLTFNSTSSRTLLIERG